MEIALAIALAVGFISLLFSFYTAYTWRGFRQGLPPGHEWSNEPHEHQYSVMLADGEGWRCGICGMPKEKEK